jgi:hypothetical protein
MRPTRWLLVTALLALAIAPTFSCSGDDGNPFTKSQCNDDKDNDMDGDVDFPADLGCVSESDDSEDTPDSPQCNDGRDNDGDGKSDFPTDPGCFAPQQDDETDDCPSGPGCPQCSDGMDNDMNGQTDYPNDAGGCASAADTDEYTQNPVACGSNVMIKKLPFDGHVTGTLMQGAPSSLTSPTCGGAGAEEVYELRVQSSKVIVATSDNPGTVADTVLYIRSADCQNNSSELICNDDISMTPVNAKSTVTQSISTPGTYYLVIDAHDAASAGAFDVTVKFFVGEGLACADNDDCGPGLVCRVPKNGTSKVCSKHVCEDTDDEDNDGKNGFPTDPGCDTPKDDDEADTCPTVGPGCPECGDTIDNDGDTMTDYGGDPTCASASSASEACVSTDGVSTITTASTMGTTVGAIHDVRVSCASTTSTAPDKTYRLDLPAMAQLSINNVNTFDGAMALYNSTCTGTVLQCGDEPENINLTNLAAGTYYYVVDGWSTGTGAYTINVSGRIQNDQSCESPLALAGAITCNTGYACKGTLGSRTCQPALCSDGLDNDAPPDGRIDYPADPGCDSPADDTEMNPAIAPVCSDALDNDTDTLFDYPADYGCVAASGTSEVFCIGEVDTTALITTFTTTGTTVGKSNDFDASMAAAQGTCPFSSNAPDVAYALSLPVPVATLVIDTNDSMFDTALTVRQADCAGQALWCDDDSGSPGTQSMITMTGVAPGAYAILVDGYSTSNGTYNLHVRGTVAPMTPCSSSLFSGGANAVLVCPAATTCTGAPLRCQ